MLLAQYQGIGHWFRTRDFLTPAYSKTNETLIYSDACWTTVDSMLAVARELGAYVIINLDNIMTWVLKSGLPGSANPYDEIWYPLYGRFIDFLTSRINPITGIRYSEDSSIMLYSLLEQPVVIQFPGDAINKLAFFFADRVRQGDPNHLIGSGGLLWLETSIFQMNANGRPYWKEMWEYANIDVCMINVYPPAEEMSAYPGAADNDWNHLSSYSRFCRDLGKPFMIQDFALKVINQPLADVTNYWQFAMDKSFACDPPMAGVGIKSFAPGRYYQIWPHQNPEVYDIIRNGATLWGYTGQFADSLRAPVTNVFPWINFGSPLFAVSQLLTFRAGTASAEKLAVSSDFSCEGGKSLTFSANFTSLAASRAGVILRKDFALGVSTWNFAPFFGTNSKLMCQVYVDDVLDKQFYMRFGLRGGLGVLVDQTDAAAMNNWLIPKRWNTVYLTLDSESAVVDWSNPSLLVQPGFLSAITQVQISIFHEAKTPAQNNVEVFIDQCQFGTLDLKQMEPVYVPSMAECTDPNYVPL